MRAVLVRQQVLQLDYVKTVLPAHYQILFSRLGPYRRRLLDDALCRSGRFTESWAHEASAIPMETWPLLRARRESWANGKWGYGPWLAKNPRYLERVLGVVRRKGPLTAQDVPLPEKPPPVPEGAWIRDVRRAALEQLFGQGRVAVSNRSDAHVREYDLAGRVVPRPELSRRVDPIEAEQALLLRAAGALGVGTAADLADYFRLAVRSARPRLEELVELGKLRRARVEGWREVGYVLPHVAAPRAVRAATLLSPFDPLIWFRPRLARLFDFDYRVEIFVPKNKRRWGVYVLPFLLGERLVARVDLKRDREAGCLRVLGSYLESHAAPAPVAEALARELELWRGWLELDSLSIGRRGNFARELRSAVKRYA
ncbi:MAG: crosslink repair DNA glycosylase YcaQ family protein [Planctomycetota bacterium]